MKHIFLILAIMLMAVVVSAQVNITMPAYDENEHFLHPGDEDNLLFFNVQNSGTNSIILQDVEISTMNMNLVAPLPDIEFYLYSNVGYSSPTFYLYDINFHMLGNVIQPGDQITYCVKGQVSQFSPTGASFKLGLSGPGNFQILEENSGTTITPIVSAGWGNQWTIVNSPTNPNQPMHRMDIYPYRNPSETTNGFPATRYVLDTLYVYPSQIFLYNGVMNRIAENYIPGSVVGIDSYVSMDTWNGLTPLMHYWQSGFLPNLGILYTGDYEMSWVSNAVSGIDDCGLMTIQVQNNIPVGQIGYIFTSLNLTNSLYQNGIIMQETCLDNKIIISNQGMIGDIDGNGSVDNLDVITGLPQWINQEVFETCFNPSDSVNIMRQVSIAPHPSTANIWALNGFVHNPNDPFFSSLGFGQPYQQNNYSIPDYINNNGVVSINTDDNFISIFWKNSDGTYGGQDIMLTDRGNALKWTMQTGIEPIEFEIQRNDTQFQLPAGAEILSVSSRQLDYSHTASDDQIIPVVTPTLSTASPNPFNSQTTIGFTMPKSGNVTIEVYNVKGQLVKILVNETKSSGNYSTTWNGTDQSGRPVSEGVYFYKMESGSYTNTKKIVLMK